MIYMEQTVQLILREHPDMAVMLGKEGTLHVIQKDELKYFKYVKNT